MRRSLLLLGLLLLAPACRADAPPPPSVAEVRTRMRETTDWLITLNESIANEHFHTGAWDHSVAALERAVTLNPARVEPYAIAAWLLWSQGRHDEALATYRRMVEANPTSPEAHFEFGLYCYGQKRYTDALPLLERAVALGIPSPKRHFYGHCLRRLGLDERALAFWRTVLAEDPADAVAKREIEALTKGALPPANPAPNP